jgi:hypothetical protein
MSGLDLKADILGGCVDVCLVPNPEVAALCLSDAAS